MIYLFWLIVVVCIGLAAKAYVNKVQKEEEELKTAKVDPKVQQFKYDPIKVDPAKVDPTDV